MIGRTLGRFRIVSELGHGGMATVWRAHDELLGRAVALKLLDPRLAGSVRLRRRFVHEARAVAHLSHPGIVAIYDAGEIEGFAYIALSLVDGETVSELATRRLLPISEAVRITVEAADALGHAHECEVIHRDVTGRNIMVAQDHRVYVLDFGLARAAWESRVTTSDTTMGTAAYLAPEVARGAEADERSDLYGLGVVLYEALTGAFPFKAERPEAMLFMSMNTSPISPRERRPEIPERLEALVLKAIARDPAERFASAPEFRAAMQALDLAPDVPQISETPGVQSRGPAPAEEGSGAVRSDGIPEPLYLALLPIELAHGTTDAEVTRAALAVRFTDGLAAALAAANGVRVIRPPATAADVSRLDPVRVARDLGANAVFRGILDGAGTQVRLSYTVHDPWRRVDIAGDVIDGSALQPFDIADRLVQSLLRRLSLGVNSTAAALSKRPHDPVAADHYAQALADLRRYDNTASVDGAIRVFEELIASEGEQAIYQAGLTRAYLHKYEYMRDRKWEARAAAACARAQALDPDAPEVHHAVGLVRLESGQHDLAIVDFERAQAARPEMAEPGLGIAKAHVGAGRHAAAEATARREVMRHPADWRCHSMLGYVYFSWCRYGEAIEPWRRVLELTPDNSKAVQNLGSAFFLLGSFEEATEFYQRSVAMKPTHLAYSNLGAALYFLYRDEEAFVWLRKATELSPQNPFRWGNLGDACRWIPGREREAEEALDRAIALMREQLDRNPAVGEWWAWLGGWLSNRGRLAEAAEVIERALALAPESTRCMVEAGHLRFLSGDQAGCLQWLRTALAAGHPRAEIERSRDLAPLRENPEFRKLFERPETGGPAGTAELSGS